MTAIRGGRTAEEYRLYLIRTYCGVGETVGGKPNAQRLQSLLWVAGYTLLSFVTSITVFFAARMAMREAAY